MGLIDLIFAGALALPSQAQRLPPVRAQGLATIFYANEPGLNNGRLGCVHEAQRLAGTTIMRDTMPIIAMRPKSMCGRLVYVEHKGRRTLTVVLDRGSWGHVDIAGNRNVSLNLPAGSRRITIADLSPAVAAAIGHDGHGRVALRWW